MIKGEFQSKIIKKIREEAETSLKAGFKERTKVILVHTVDITRSYDIDLKSAKPNYEIAEYNS